MTTGYLDPNAYKKGKGKATSQIELRSQNGQTEQRSFANSTLNITNREAVSHHYSYDRQAEKDMGSTTRSSGDIEVVVLMPILWWYLCCL